jgi:hypothetical protein
MEKLSSLKTIDNNNMFLSNSSDKLNSILNNDIISSKKVNWTRKNKTEKIKKLYEYADQYSKKNGYDDIKRKRLRVFLKGKLDQKRLINNKDVIYNVESDLIEDIPILNHNNNKFTLKRTEKRNSTLKSLTPCNKNIKISK